MEYFLSNKNEKYKIHLWFTDIFELKGGIQVYSAFLLKALEMNQILQGTYPKPLMYKPDALRQRMSNTFGFEQFKQTLAELMKNSPIGS